MRDCHLPRILGAFFPELGWSPRARAIMAELFDKYSLRCGGSAFPLILWMVDTLVTRMRGAGHKHCKRLSRQAFQDAAQQWRNKKRHQTQSLKEKKHLTYRSRLFPRPYIRSQVTCCWRTLRGSKGIPSSNKALRGSTTSISTHVLGPPNSKIIAVKEFWFGLCGIGGPDVWRNSCEISCCQILEVEGRKSTKHFAQNFAAFLVSLLEIYCQIFHTIFALGDYGHNMFRTSSYAPSFPPNRGVASGTRSVPRPQGHHHRDVSRTYLEKLLLMKWIWGNKPFGMNFMR